MANYTNTALGTQAGNTLQEGSNKIRSALGVSENSEILVKAPIQMAQDNTRVVLTVIK